MTAPAATMAVTIAADAVGFVAADHTLPDSCELRKVFANFATTEATGVRTGMSDGPRITADPPRGVACWHTGPRLEVILTKARAREQVFVLVRGWLAARRVRSVAVRLGRPRTGVGRQPDGCDVEWHLSALCAGGRAVATWSMHGGRVRLEPFDPLAAKVLADLDREARVVERFPAPH